MLAAKRRPDAQREAYAAHMAAQRAGRPEAAQLTNEAARQAALASTLSAMERQRILSYLNAGARIERSVVDWRARLELSDGRFLSVFRHHLDSVMAERAAA